MCTEANISIDSCATCLCYMPLMFRTDIDCSELDPHYLNTVHGTENAIRPTHSQSRSHGLDYGTNNPLRPRSTNVGPVLVPVPRRGAWVPLYCVHGTRAHTLGTTALKKLREDED